MRFSYVVPIMVLVVFITTYCTKSNVKETKEYITSKNEKALSMIKSIEVINSNSASSFKMEFIVEGKFKGKKNFKSLGKAFFTKEPRRMMIIFYDYVFKSPLTIMAQDGDNIKFYFPVEKKLYLDKATKINFKSYTDLDLDYFFVSTLTMGMIPIIKNYSIKQSLTEKDGKDKENKESFLILENDYQFQTIVMKNSIPEKILIINKVTKEKYEFYMENPYYKSKTLYYKAIRFYSQATGDRMSIRFKSIKHNAKIRKKEITEIKPDKGVKIERIN